MQKFDVIILSIYGRGHWLASELSTKGLKVALVEVSSLLGKDLSQYQEGPFGYVKTNEFRHSQSELLSPSSVLVENGFSLLSNKGPFEYNGPLTLYHLNQMMNSDSIVDSSFLNEAINYLNLIQYEYSSNEYKKNVEYYKATYKTNLREQFYIRYQNSESFQKELNHLSKINVSLFSDFEITGISFSQKNTLQRIEIKSHSQRTEQQTLVIEAEKFVFCLEPASLNRVIKDQLAQFPIDLPRPKWLWSEFLFEIELNGKYLWPDYFLLIHDIDQHWVGENYLLVKKSLKAGGYQIWCKIPFDQKDNSNYLKDKMDLIEEVLTTEFPMAQIAKTKQINVSDDFPIYEKIAALKNPFKNIDWHIPYVWDHLSMNGQLNFQAELLKKIEVWWNKKQELLRKQEQKMAKGQS